MANNNVINGGIELNGVQYPFPEEVTKDTAIGSTPSTTNVPTSAAVASYVAANQPTIPTVEQTLTVTETDKVPSSKAVSDYVSEHNFGDYVIEENDSSDDELVSITDNNDKDVIKITHSGIFVKGIKDIDGNSILSFLDGKVVASIGDSITHGAGTIPIPDGDNNLPINASSSTNKQTYMYFISKFCRCKWYNYGQSGTCMGDVHSMGRTLNNFSKENGRYTQMASNIDYFIIMFGTNDNDYGAYYYAEAAVREHFGTDHFAPGKDEHKTNEPGVWTTEEEKWVNDYSGEIDGKTYTGIEYFRQLYIGHLSDSTNKTWCGAWNIVLEYIMLNYPKSKILIWLNPTNYTFDESTIKLAEKWGVPYINLHDCQLPTIWSRDEQKDTLIDGANMNTYSSGRKKTKKDIYLSDGLHPNVDGYEYIYPVLYNKLNNI